MHFILDLLIGKSYIQVLTDLAWAVTAFVAYIWVKCISPRFYMWHINMFVINMSLFCYFVISYSCFTQNTKKIESYWKWLKMCKGLFSPNPCSVPKCNHVFFLTNRVWKTKVCWRKVFCLQQTLSYGEKIHFKCYCECISLIQECIC